MKMNVAVRFGAIASLSALVLIAAACPAKDAAAAVNKYANTLSAVQDGEIKLHDAGTVNDDFHIKFQKAMQVASKAGHNLDTCITIADQGGDASGCVESARASYSDVLALIKPANIDTLNALGQAAADALENAISLINSIKKKPSPGTPASSGTAIWLVIGGGGLVGIAISASDILKFLKIGVALEPTAFDLVVKLAESLQGKTAEEIIAMNETIFGKVADTAEAEIEKTENKIAASNQ